MVTLLLSGLHAFKKQNMRQNVLKVTKLNTVISLEV